MKNILSIDIYTKLFISLSLFVPLNFTYAIEYGGFGGRPANFDPNNPRTESIFIHTISPGETREDAIRVINNSLIPKTFLVYSTDSTPSTGGAFACEQLSEEKDDVGLWIELLKTEVEVLPAKNEVVPFKIKVPESASVGEHNGCIFIQEKKDETRLSGANISLRTGLRVAVTIPGDISRELSIESFNLNKRGDGSILITPKIKNLGNVSVDTLVSVNTKYFFGKKFFEHGGQYPILRGELTELNFELSKPFWGGWYKTNLTVSYDKNSNKSPEDSLSQNIVTLEGPTILFFSPPTKNALLILIALLILVISILFMWVRSIRRKKWIEKHWVLHRVTKSEDIQEIAKSHHVSWSLLASVNDIKPPYVVEAGEVIKVPPIKKKKENKNERQEF